MAAQLCKGCNLAQSTYSCECNLRLCAPCATNHSRSTKHFVEGFHSSSFSEPTNETCSDCRESSAQSFCCCQSQHKSMCSQCMTKHIMKNSSSLLHIPLPLKARPYANAPGYIDRVRNRQLAKSQAETLLEDALSRSDTKEQEVLGKCEKAITEIQTQMMLLSSEFKRHRTTILHNWNCMIAELEEHLYDDSYVPVNHVSNQLWAFQPGSSITPLHLSLEFADTLSDKLSKLLAVEHETSTTLQPDLQEGKIIVFDSATETWKPPIDVHETITVKYCSAFVWLPKNSLVICGGYPPLSPKVWSVEMNAGTVSCLPDMLEARRRHAAVYHNGTIYVFGGETSSLMNSNTAEKMTIPEEHWNSLPNMFHGTSNVTPCVHEGYVYLCGGKGGVSCQCFGLLDEQFSLLPLTLPKIGSTFAFVEKGELIVMQSERLGRWQIGGKKQQFQFTSIEENYQKDVW